MVSDFLLQLFENFVRAGYVLGRAYCILIGLGFARCWHG